MTKVPSVHNDKMSKRKKPWRYKDVNEENINMIKKSFCAYTNKFLQLFTT